ncbi:MAG: SH3 domain-containing protein [Chloroflexota bacterium]|nr:SH3 domain-containing protein [Chloroflexota bacterium]
MSDQIEDQDWTDSLRIALPAIGLLLLLALFWFWAGSLIDDGDDAPSLAVVRLTTASEVLITPAPTTPSPTPQPTPALVPTQNAAGAHQETPAAPAPTGADLPDVAPAHGTQDPNPGTGFAVGSIVVTTEDGVRLRSGPSIDTDVVQELGPKGTMELRVTGAGESDGQDPWYPVTGGASGSSGYVRGDLLQRSE